MQIQGLVDNMVERTLTNLAACGAAWDSILNKNWSSQYFVHMAKYGHCYPLRTKPHRAIASGSRHVGMRCL